MKRVLLLLAMVAVAVLAAPSSLPELADRYHLQVVPADGPFAVTLHFGNITGGAPLYGDVDDYSYLLLDEFGLYPPKLVEKSRLKRLVLCSHLQFANQPRNAVPDFVHNTLYLKTEPTGQMGGLRDAALYRRLVIHHEFFHVVDNEMGVLYHDPDWEKLNPPDFHYGKDSPRLPDTPDKRNQPWFGPGFVSVYAMSAVEEDKAETFAYLMVQYGRTLHQAVNDPVLRAKIDLMKRRLQDLSPEMTDGWWDELSRTPLDVVPRHH